MEFSNIFEMPYMPFALLAFGGGLLFTIQLLLSFIGVGMDTEGSGIGDLGASDYSFKFLSIMSISSFCMVGGIFGLYALTLFDPDSGWRIPAAVITTLITGGIMVYLSGLISSALAKIQGSGTVKAANAVGKTAKVYLTIKPGSYDWKDLFARAAVNISMRWHRILRRNSRPGNWLKLYQSRMRIFWWLPALTADPPYVRSRREISGTAACFFSNES